MKSLTMGWGVPYEIEAQDAEQAGETLLVWAKVLTVASDMGIAHTTDCNDEDGYNIYITFRASDEVLTRFIPALVDAGIDPRFMAMDVSDDEGE